MRCDVEDFLPLVSVCLDSEKRIHALYMAGCDINIVAHEGAAVHVPVPC
jgi:hypothetical protein